jgi:hypothetical protein
VAALQVADKPELEQRLVAFAACEPGDARGVAAELDAARKNSGTLPVVASETGYHDALAAPGDHPPVPEDVAATYLPRLFLSAFRAGVRRTFAYELLDERPDPARTDAEAGFGLLREDLSPKPSYTALRNLIAALRPAGPPSEASPPAVSVRGPAVERLLLDRGEGRFALVLWQSAPVWDPQTNAPDRTGQGRDRPALVTRGEGRDPQDGGGRPTAAALEEAREVRVAVPTDPIVVMLEP